MFQKISTINRFLAAAFVIVFSFGVLVYAFTVPIVRDEIFRLEEDAARTILDNVSTLLENKAEEIEDFKRSSLEAHRRELRNITLVAYNHVRARQLSSSPGGEQAKMALLEELRNFRYGGEEFVLLLPGANVDISLDRAERLRSQVENDLAIPHPSGALKVTISAGVAVCPLQGTNFDAIFHAADQALYQAKAGGRNRVVLHAANRS